MFSVSNVIILNEIVKITFLFLFFYMLLCIYFCLFFFKNYIFLVAFNDIKNFRLNSKIILQSEFYRKTSAIGFKIKNRFIIVYAILCSIKTSKEFFSFSKYIRVDTFLMASTFISLLYLKKKINNVEVVVEKLMNILPYLHFLFYFMILFFLMYVGYVKRYVKQETYLYPEFYREPKIIIPFILVMEGYFVVVFYLLQSLYKVSKIILTCLFKYLENLYYNLLPKLNLLVIFLVWTMLWILDETNKYKALFNKYTISGLLLVFFFFSIFYFCLKKTNKFSFLVDAYIFCINAYLAICIFIIVLIEQTIVKNFYNEIIEYLVIDYVKINILFIILVSIIFLQNKKFWFSDEKYLKIKKVTISKFLDFIVKILGYFLVNGFVIGRVMVGGIIKNVTDGAVDPAILEVIETAKETPVPTKGLTKKDIPETSHDLMVFIADNVVEIKKDNELRKAVSLAYEHCKNMNKGFRLLMNINFPEGEGCSRHWFDCARKSIVLHGYPPIYIPDTIKRGPDHWMPGTNRYEQQKLYDNVTVSKIKQDHMYYKPFNTGGLLDMVVYFDRISKKKEVLEYIQKYPEQVRGTRFVNSIRAPERNPQDIIFAEKWAVKNEKQLVEMQVYQAGKVNTLMRDIIRKFPKK